MENNEVIELMIWFNKKIGAGIIPENMVEDLMFDSEIHFDCECVISRNSTNDGILFEFNLFGNRYRYDDCRVFEPDDEFILRCYKEMKREEDGKS